MKTINYTGTSKLISRIVHLLNRKAPLPLDGQGDAVWGTNGQVLTTDGNGNTSWTTPQGGGGDVTDVEVNGTSVVNAQGVAEVSVPTKTSDLNNDSGFIDSTDLSTALADYTPTASLASVATSGNYSDLNGTPSDATQSASGLMSSTDKTKLDGIASGAEANVQSDWTQADNTADDYIKNKPTKVSDFQNDSGFITSVAMNDISDVSFTNLSNGQIMKYNSTTQKWENANESGGSTYTEGDGIDISAQDVISVDTTFSDASTRTNIASGDSFSTILGKIKKFFTDLKTVAFTGAYSDLSGTPDLTNVAYKNINNQFSKNQTIDQANGTTTTPGDGALTLGNNIPDGTAGNSRGRLVIYGKYSYYTLFRAPNSTANREILLPNKDGTLALKEDVGTLETGTITSTYLQKRSLKKKNGNVCLFFRTLNNISNGTTIGTIAEGYRPSAPLWIPCVGYDGSGVNVTSYGIAEIGTDGKIVMKSSSATFNYMSCSANYYV